MRLVAWSTRYNRRRNPTRYIFLVAHDDCYFRVNARVSINFSQQLHSRRVYDVMTEPGCGDEEACRMVFHEWTRNLQIALSGCDEAEQYCKQIESAILRHCKRARSYDYDDDYTSTSLPSKVDISMCPVDYQAQFIGPFNWTSIARIDTDTSLNLSNCEGYATGDLDHHLTHETEQRAAFHAADAQERDRYDEIMDDLDIMEGFDMMAVAYNDEVAFRKVSRCIKLRQIQLDAIFKELQVHLATDIARMVCDSLVRLPSLHTLEAARAHFWRTLYTQKVLPRLRPLSQQP
jgi:predicted GIY-YIG superfamily endonuclease